MLVNVTAQTAYGRSKAESYGNGVRTEAVLRRTGAADRDRHDSLNGGDDPGQRLRLAQRRLARAPYRPGRGAEPIQARRGVRLRLPEPADGGGDVYLGGSATASRTLAFDYDLRGNLKIQDQRRVGGQVHHGLRLRTGTNRLS